MEVEFLEVSLDNSLDNISFKVQEGKILGVVSDNKEELEDLILMHKKPSNGVIKYNDFEFNIDSKNMLISEIKSKIGIVKNYIEKKFLTNSVREELELFVNNEVKDKEKKCLDSLKLVNLSSSIIERNPNNLSTIEKSKLSFACTLLSNPSLLVLDNIEFGMNYGEVKELKKLLIKLKTRYKKTIIVFTNNIDFQLGLVDNYLVINKGKVCLSGSKNDFYNEKLYNYCEKPLIVEFIKYANKKGHHIEEYTDLKELIKGIYRDV